jgi:hypothetical protein
MRFVYAVFAFALWGTFLAFLAGSGFVVTLEQFVISMSIVVAGALAGGG